MLVMDVREEDLQELYLWVDSIPLSRPKKNIARDFSDGGERQICVSSTPAPSPSPPPACCNLAVPARRRLTWRRPLPTQCSWRRLSTTSFLAWSSCITTGARHTCMNSNSLAESLQRHMLIIEIPCHQSNLS